jgi:hypothetical protein
MNCKFCNEELINNNEMLSCHNHTDIKINYFVDSKTITVWYEETFITTQYNGNSYFKSRYSNLIKIDNNYLFEHSLNEAIAKIENYILFR